MRHLCTILLSTLLGFASAGAAEAPILLKPDRVFDGATATPHAGLGRARAGREDRGRGAGGRGEGARRTRRSIELPGATLLPGLIDAHSHLLLHPYDETTWDDQVLKEPLAERVCRATNHAKAGLLSGFTTLRDLGTEGAGYADVGIKSAIEKGIIPGPRLLVTTKAIVATGSYAPRAFAPE